MKLLILSHNPDRASFRQRIEIYLDILRDNGINCEIAVLPAGWLARRKLFKSAGNFDTVFLHKRTLNPIDAYYLGRNAKKIIYDFDDAVMFDDKSPEETHYKRQNYFHRNVRLADLVIAGNPCLAQHAQRFNPNVIVLPTGLNTAAFDLPFKRENDGRVRLVWIGSKTTLRYLVGISPALEEIGKRFNNVTLRIISDAFFDLQNMNVEKRPWSLKTELQDLAGSDIGLAPLPDNRFTMGKCGFKILQYASATLPVIASPVGTNKDCVQEGITGFFAADSSHWVEKITTLVKDPQLRKKMGVQGRLFAQQFDISVIGKRLCEIISSCVSQS